jgi:hypothetical protein
MPVLDKQQLQLVLGNSQKNLKPSPDIFVTTHLVVWIGLEKDNAQAFQRPQMANHELLLTFSL